MDSYAIESLEIQPMRCPSLLWFRRMKVSASMKWRAVAERHGRRGYVRTEARTKSRSTSTSYVAHART